MSTFEKPQIIVHIQKGLNYTVFDCKWVPCSAKFVTMGNFARGTGVIQVYEIQRGDLKLLREVSAGLDRLGLRDLGSDSSLLQLCSSFAPAETERRLQIEKCFKLGSLPASSSRHPPCSPLQGFWEVKLTFHGNVLGPFRLFAVVVVY